VSPFSFDFDRDYLELKKLDDGWVKEYYFTNGADTSIHDPQSYLSGVEKEVLVEMLKRHSEVSQVTIHLFIMGAGQTLGKGSVERLAKDFLKEENSALMFYFIGDSKLTKGYIRAKGDPVGDDKGKPFLDPFIVSTMFSKAGLHAETLKLEKNDALYATLDEVSKRMYWIEQELGLVTAFKVQLENKEVEEVDEQEEVEASSYVAQLWEQLGGSKSSLSYLKKGGVVAVVLLITALILMIYRSKKLIKFPSYSGPSRLSAEYGAGVAEVVKFKDARVSLADQKKRIKLSDVYDEIK